MSFEDSLEKGISAKPHVAASKMTLQKAVDLGEYDPEYLAIFPEWHELSRHVQFQFVRAGLDNRRKQLITQYAELNNVLDFRLKPNIKDALTNIMKQLKDLDREMERLYLEYSK